MKGYQEQIKYIGQEMRLIVKVKNEMICVYRIVSESDLDNFVSLSNYDALSNANLVNVYVAFRSVNLGLYFGFFVRMSPFISISRNLRQ